MAREVPWESVVCGVADPTRGTEMSGKAPEEG